MTIGSGILKRSRFPFGELALTPGVSSLTLPQIESLLQEHGQLVPGLLCAEDVQHNEDALVHGDRILSAYNTMIDNEVTKVWVITEWDRSATTIMLPGEY